MQTLVDLFEMPAPATSTPTATPAPQDAAARETLVDLDEIAWEETFQTGESLPRNRGARFWSSED